MSDRIPSPRPKDAADFREGAGATSPRSRRLDAINAAVMSAVVLGLLVGNFVVDPFGLNRRFDLGLDRQVSKRVSHAHWSLAHFLHTPAPVVLLGDSRMEHLPEEAIAQLTGLPVVNLGIGGATARDIVDAFWFAVAHGSVERVVIGLNLTNMNSASQRSRVDEARELVDSPLAYYLSPFITQASIKLLLHEWLGIAVADERPPMTPEEFWRFQLDVTAKSSLADFHYADDIIRALGDIASYCEDRGIDLYFVEFPTHVDLHRKIDEWGLAEVRDRFRRDLAELGPLIELNAQGPLIDDASNFRDPYHTTPEVSARLAELVASRLLQRTVAATR